MQLEALEDRAAPAVLVAAYPFDEGTGIAVTDVSGAGNHGAASNTTWSTAGRFGDALAFNGTSALVNIPHSASLNLTAGMTLEAWVKPTAVSAAWRDVIYKGNDRYYLEGTSSNGGFPAGGATVGTSNLEAYGTAALATDTWTHLAATYDGATMRLYVNGTQVSSTPRSGAIQTSTNPLQIGGDSVFGQYFAGLIDEVRVYDGALSATEIQSDMNTPVSATPDTEAPSAPGNLLATAATENQINLSWAAATDNVAVSEYRVERQDPGGGFAQIGTAGSTTFASGGLTTGTTYSYRVRAVDLAGNVGPYSDVASATTFAHDTQSPTVAITFPSTGATATHVTVVTATASDNVGVTSVEFFVDGSSLGTDTTAPYTVNWNSTTLANGLHSLTAVAHDAAGNAGSSASVSVTVENPGFVNEVVVPDITSATTMAFLPDGRMLVGELINVIWVVQPGASAPDATPFLQLSYDFLFGEQGLMDIAVDPDFDQNGYIYVFYTQGFTGEHNRDRLSRFTASGNAVVPGSEVVLWQAEIDANAEHHGGAIAFGNDGKIYFTTGEYFNPPLAQQLDSYQGKVLRINKDGSIPTDNPFYDGTGPNKDAIWAYGLRNPYRMSIDPATGAMYIGDVGGNDPNTSDEELDLGVAGANYGWPLEEGNGGTPGVTPPIYTYPHSGHDAAITGGFVYHGSQFPSEYDGSYFFGDFARNTIQRLTFDAGGNVTGVVDFWPADGAIDGSTVGDPVKFVQGPDGALYYVDIGFDGYHVPNPAAIRRIRYTIGDQPPLAMASAAPTVGQAPLSVDFSSAGSSDPEGAPLSYLWTFGDGQTSTAANPTHVYQTAGDYTARLSVSDGTNSTLSSDLAITVGNPPVPVILSPTDGMSFRAGDVITYAGSATDPEDGTLPASAFSWTIVFHHDTHTHPGGGPFTGTTSGTLAIPTSGHDFQDSTSYEISLTVTDSTGLQASTSVTIYPDKVDLMFDTIPSGLTVSIDGINHQTPFVLDEIINFQHTIAAPLQTSGSSTYTFVSWSDGGAQGHDVVVPAVNQSYIATFQLDVAPTDISLTPGAVAENQPAGTTAGSLATTDTNPGDTFTYSLVSGAGSADNGLFQIVGGQLLTTTAFDYESQSSYAVRVRSTDQGGLYVEKPLVVQVTDVNESPTADAGGPYAIVEGASLALNASALSDPELDPLTYSWDVNGDGTFGDATGVAPTLSWTQLAALGIVDGPANLMNVRVRVDDGHNGLVTSPATTLTVNNAAPVAGISGPTTVLRGELQSYMLTAADPSPTDQAVTFAFVIDWGDGTPAQSVNGFSGKVVAHRFETAGPLTVGVTATDKDGDVSPSATASVQVDKAELRPNAQNPALVDLVWGGSDGADQVEFSETTGTTVRVHETLSNGTSVDITQDFSGVTGRLVAYGNAGDDRLDARGLTTRQATLDGGADDNTLYGGPAGDVLIGGIDGGEGQQGSNVIIAGNGTNTIYGNAPVGLKGSTGGNNLIVGGSGNDTIYGNFGSVETKHGSPSDGAEGGQNLVVGGGGSDTIYASQMVDGAEGGHGSMLIAGSTSLDESALLSVLSEWTSGRTYAEKIANIAGTGTGPRNNGTDFLQAGVTLFDDSSPDDLYSDTEGDLNWLLYAFADDTSHRVKSGEAETDV